MFLKHFFERTLFCKQSQCKYSDNYLEMDSCVTKHEDEVTIYLFVHQLREMHACTQGNDFVGFKFESHSCRR